MHGLYFVILLTLISNKVQYIHVYMYKKKDIIEYIYTSTVSTIYLLSTVSTICLLSTVSTIYLFQYR